MKSLILSGLFACSVCDGYIFGQMSGMLAAMHSDEELNLNDDQISWIASMINVTSVLGFGIAGVITELVGRRRAVSILCTPLLANWVLVYFARDYGVFLLSRFIVGICFGGGVLLVIIATSEYTDPNTRALSLNVTGAVGTAAGTMLGHVLSTILHWRTVALIGVIPTILAIVLPFFWVESPSWLASKGKFEECRKSFKALHGHRGIEAEKELELLIEVEHFKRNKRMKTTESALNYFTTIKHAMRQRYFWKLALCGLVINIYRVAAGKVQYSTLAINMLQDITRETDVLLYAILVDLFFVIGSLLSCFLLLSRMKILTLLFPSAIISNIILLILSACIYFRPETSSIYPWINSILLALYFIIINAGPYPVLEAIQIEIVPLEIKSFILFAVSMIVGSIFALSIKLIGPMQHLIGYHGIFMLNLGIMSLCLVFFWFTLPETKGRTLQEIELFTKIGTFENQEQMLERKEEMKVLA